jgi:hypothetical protein
MRSPCSEGLSTLRLASLAGHHSNVVRYLAEQAVASVFATATASIPAVHNNNSVAPPPVDEVGAQPTPNATTEQQIAASALRGTHINPTWPKVCAWWCGKTTPRTRPKLIVSCARCMAVWYCRRHCQHRHWEAGHRQERVQREAS